MTEPTRELVRELIELRRSNRAGRIEVCTGELTTTLVIEGGDVVEVKASKPGEPLGRILTQKRLLTQEQYVDVLERMSSALALGETVRFGEIAIELGYVDEVAVRKCLSEQQRLLASRAFQGASPTWTVHEATVAPDPSRDAPMRVEALFLFAVRWADDARKGVLGLDAARGEPLGAAWDFDEIDARFCLTKTESDFVRGALTGGKTLAELIDGGGPNDDVDDQAILTALIASGAAAPLVPGKPARTPTTPPARVREVPRPLRAWAIDGARAKSALEKVRLAKNTVAPASANEAARLVEVQLRSEQAFQRGKELLQRGGPAAALPELERALELRPDCAEYELFVKWARLADQPDGFGAASRAELERLAKAALRDNSKLAFGYFVLGEVLREQGDLEESRRQLRYALRFEPELFAGIRAHRRGGARGSSPSLEAVRPSGSAPDQAESTALAKDAKDDSAAPPPVAGPPALLPAAVLADEQEPERGVKSDVDRSAAKDSEPADSEAADSEPADSEAADSAPAAATADAPTDEPGPAAEAVPDVPDVPAPATTRSSRTTLLLAAGGAVVAVVVGVAVLRSSAGPTPTPTPPAPSASVVEVAPTSTTSSSPEADAAELAPASPSATTTPPIASDAGPTVAVIADSDASGSEAGAVDAARGVLVLGARAAGHRVFVDGRVAVVVDGRVTVSCGRHDVRVGSQGKSISLDVPCGGERAVP